jgi:nitrate/TMAO reductase-like tetraheme cytochrome c subunit
MHELSLAAVLTLVLAAVAALTLLHYLVRRPKLDARVRMQLLFGLGVFPVATAAASTAYGMHRTTERSFCGSCHVMGKHQSDVDDPASGSLAARHGRNNMFGQSNCYTCHADYGMLGYPLTKLNGMKHVYHYYIGHYGKMPLDEALRVIRVNKPFPNSNCMQCHSGQLDSFKAVREHRALEADLLTNTVACASAGCHGYSHPFNKDPATEERAAR